MKNFYILGHAGKAIEVFNHLFWPTHAPTVSIKHPEPSVSSGGAKLEGAEWVCHHPTARQKACVVHLLSAAAVVSMVSAPQGWAHYCRVSTCIFLSDKLAASWLKERAVQTLTFPRICPHWKCENLSVSFTRTCAFLSVSTANKSTNFPGLRLDVEVLRPPIPQWQLTWAMVQYWFSMCKNKILILPLHRSAHLHETENTTFEIEEFKLRVLRSKMSHLSHSYTVESFLLHHPAAPRTFEIFYHHKEGTNTPPRLYTQAEVEVHTYAFLCSCFGGAPETEPVSNPLLLSRSASYKCLHTSLCPALSISSPFILPLPYYRFHSLVSLLSSNPLLFSYSVWRERGRKREQNECLLRRANTE